VKVDQTGLASVLPRIAFINPPVLPITATITATTHDGGKTSTAIITVN
jgi:uncharacterized protein YjdB